MEHFKGLIKLSIGLWREITHSKLGAPGSTGAVELELCEDELIWSTRRLTDRNWQKLYQVIDLAG